MKVQQETGPSGRDGRPKEIGKNKGPVGGERWGVVEERLTTEEDKWCGKGQAGCEGARKARGKKGGNLHQAKLEQQEICSL